MPKEQIITRLNFLNDSMSAKLDIRPTKEEVKFVMDKQDKRIEQLGSVYDEQVQQVETIQADMNKELKLYNDLISKIQAELEKKIESPILKPIWQYFDRFALYEDLINLHKMVIPEVAKYEQVLKKFTAEMDNNNQIIREFDNSISQKANKVTFNEL